MDDQFDDPSVKKVLVVDGDEIVLSALKEQLPQFGFHATAVNSATLAKEHLTTEMFAVAIIDGNLGGEGMKLLELARDKQPDCSRVMLASGISVDELTRVIESDLIFRYLSKPWMGNDLHVTMMNASERYQMKKANEALQTRNMQLSEQMASGGGGGDEGGSSVGGEELALEAINRMLYTFHPNLGNTAMRAKALCQTLAEVMELTPEDSRTLAMAAQMHDIGLMNTEVGVVRRWLRDPEKCSEEEIAVIEEHPDIGEKILLHLDEEAYAAVAKAVRHHHEHWDGTGYPDKLKGQTIPKLSRLVSPVIFYCNQNAADVQLIKYMGTELADHVFDPDAVRALVKSVPLTRMPRGEREILLIELRSGMELARPIFNTNGMKLLDAGKVLEDRHINKVLSINRMTPISPLCLVFC